MCVGGKYFDSVLNKCRQLIGKYQLAGSGVRRCAGRLLSNPERLIFSPMGLVEKSLGQAVGMLRALKIPDFDGRAIEAEHAELAKDASLI